MIAPLDRVQLALHVFLTINSLLRLVMKDKKSEAGPALGYLGLFATMPDGSSDSSLKLEITASRRDKLVNLLDKLIRREYIPRSELDSLIGKLAFAQSSVTVSSSAT